jgi:hypothetical protein
MKHKRMEDGDARLLFKAVGKLSRIDSENTTLMGRHLGIVC